MNHVINYIARRIGSSSVWLFNGMFTSDIMVVNPAFNSDLREKALVEDAHCLSSSGNFGTMACDDDFQDGLQVFYLRSRKLL